MSLLDTAGLYSTDSGTLWFDNIRYFISICAFMGAYTGIGTETVLTSRRWRRWCLAQSYFSSERHARCALKPGMEVGCAMVAMYIRPLSTMSPDLFMGKCASDATDQIPPRQHLRTCIYLWILFVLTVGSVSTCWLFFLLLALSLASLLLSYLDSDIFWGIHLFSKPDYAWLK